MLVNGQYEATPENTWIVHYPNDLLDGILMDFQENYGFISAHENGANYDHIAAQLVDEGVEIIEVDPDGLDLTEIPHCWVVQSVIKAVVRSVEVPVDET